MSNKEFKFEVDPTESSESREIRWDKELLQLAAQGLTIEGTGPDGDYPVRYAFGDGTMSFDEWWTGNPATPWHEVYNLVPLEEDGMGNPAGHDHGEQDCISGDGSEAGESPHGRRLTNEEFEAFHHTIKEAESA